MQRKKRKKKNWKWYQRFSTIDIDNVWEHKDTGFLKNAYWETSLLCIKATSNSRASFWTLDPQRVISPQVSCFNSVYSFIWANVKFSEKVTEKDQTPESPRKHIRMGAVPEGAVHGGLVLCSRADIRHDCVSEPRGEAGRVLCVAHRSVMYHWRLEESRGRSATGLIKPNGCRDNLTQY